MSKIRHIEIYDTTLRDGAQAEGVAFGLEDKLLIAEQLDAIGIDFIEGGYPLSNPKDKAFFEQIRRRRLRRSKIAAFGMTRRRGVRPSADAGLKALLASEAEWITIVGKSWDLHVRRVLRVPLKENLKMIADSVALMVKRGRQVIFDAEHFFDGYRAKPAHAMASLSAALEAGAVRLVLCDTNGGSLPEYIGAVVVEVVGSLPGVKIGIHCHNDSALAVANSLAAVAAGATHVQGTVNGIGERCGNADLTSVVPNLVLKRGCSCLGRGKLAELTRTSRFVNEIANLSPIENQPFVGLAAFAHKGGMHVHAIRRDPATYEHVPPATVGNQRRVLISELSGSSNVAVKAPAKFRLQKDPALLKKVLRAVQDKESLGYQYEAADGSFELLIRRTLGGKWHRPLWELDHYRCVILKATDARTSTEAVLKMRVNGDTMHTAAEGDGPVNALDGALRKALLPAYPSLDGLQLIDYKVRVVNPRAGTAARVRVAIEFHDSALGYFGTIGADENIIHASWQALTDGVEYKLLNEMERRRTRKAPRG